MKEILYQNSKLLPLRSLTSDLIEELSLLQNTHKQFHLSGLSSNTTIVPLFEKVLSASDAGRIGCLVLPKACTEAYFPLISQPEGLPLKIRDVKGKDWLFQFRFWPNINSRMYVLEGVTPCIQSMQLQLAIPVFLISHVN
ncbi:putative transcription factor B3-Domain family [Helianthus annuus]|nr:putative transcription factor B3-Domain family [Helianthus annuus]